MEDKELLNLVKRLLKRKPTNLGGLFEELTVDYRNGDSTYCISVSNYNGYKIHFRLETPKQANIYRDIEVSEKEYMEVKWQIEYWTELITNSEFDLFREFAERDDSQMDDLLDD